MKTHEIKLDIAFCDAVLSGIKTFEIRRNDRGYEKGDHIKFLPIDNGVMTVHNISKKEYEITYILSGWGLKDDYVVLAIKEKCLKEQHFYNELCQSCINWDWCEHK